MRDSIILLTRPVLGERLAALCRQVHTAPPVLAFTDSDLASAVEKAGPDALIIGYSTSVIVTPAILGRLSGPAYNFHAASPAYPGRDPHHWAIYQGATRYGATAHIMAETVDSGPIVGVRWVDVPEDATPGSLLAMADGVMLELFMSLLPALIASPPGPAPLPGVCWRGPRRTRADFRKMCRLSPDIDADEFERRYRAFDGEAYDNLTVDLHGRRFRIDKSIPDR